jgi:hypothetical protein
VPSPPLPNFLIIGAPRCATRWLRTNLIEHPDVYLPPFDVRFFDRGQIYRQGGGDWYRRQFEAWHDERCVGESSPGYLSPRNEPRDIAERVQELLPDVRLVALVRQPVDRMYSAMFHEIRQGRLPSDADVFTMVTEGHPEVVELELVSAGLYGKNLYPYWHRFGEQLLVVFQDDVRTQPEKVYEQVLRHIGASTDFRPPHLDEVLFSSRSTVRYTGPRPTEEQFRILYRWFREDVEELEAMIGADLSRWDPGPPPAPEGPKGAWFEMVDE